MGVFFGIGGEGLENYVFSKDGEKLATFDVDAEHHLILQVWNVTAGKELWRSLDKDGASLNPPPADEGPAQGDASKRPFWDRAFDLALVGGYLLRTEADGWRLFCERLNVPPFLLWGILPG